MKRDLPDIKFHATFPIPVEREVTMLTDDQTAIMTPEVFASLGEYSCSLPTGTVLGKIWKRNNNAYDHQHLGPEWFMGEYVPDPKGDPTMVGIKWRRIIIIGD